MLKVFSNFNYNYGKNVEERVKNHPSLNSKWLEKLLYKTAVILESAVKKKGFYPFKFNAFLRKNQIIWDLWVVFVTFNLQGIFVLKFHYF